MQAERKIFNNLYVLSRWWRTWKTIPVISWVRGAALYRQGKFEAAEKYYLKGLEKNSAHPAEYCARLDLAYCQFKIGKLEEAEEQLRFVAARIKNAREAHLRLARLKLWSGRGLEAAWTLRRLLREEPKDAEIVSAFLFAVLDSGAPKYMWTEALREFKELNEEQAKDPRVRAVRARCAIIRGEAGTWREELENIALQPEAPFEAILLFAETLLEEGKVSYARMELRRALILEPNHPRTLSMLAEIYLRSGPFYNPQYAEQLASTACRHSGWLSAREMHILAEAYYHSADHVSALIIANKAKQMGSKLLGNYPHISGLERLIENLKSSQTVWLKSRVV